MRVPTGWQYKDGSIWPSLNALRDHLLGVSRAAAESDRLAALLEGQR